MSTPPNQPVQLRLGFRAPLRPMHLDFGLSGVMVLTSARDGTDDEVFAALVDVGAHPELRPGVGVCFPVRHLAQLRELAPPCTLTFDADLDPLWDLVTHPCDDALPVTLSLDAYGSLALEWDSNGISTYRTLPSSSAPGLVALDLPFVATSSAWEMLELHARVPASIARVSLNEDGFLELAASRPQLVETSPLPGLFQLDATHFGLSLAYADRIDPAQGFTWSTRPPRPSPATRPVHLHDVELKAHLHAQLTTLLADLDRFGGKVLCWPAGSSRRLCALAALEALDAYPAHIVVPPASVWVWGRLLDLLGRTWSLSHDRNDVYLVTYLDVAHRQPHLSPQALIFDAPDVAEAALAFPALKSLGALRDCVRIATLDTWPDDPQRRLEVLELVRPSEFRSDLPLPQRYPLDPSRRFAEHAAPYVSFDPGTFDPSESFRRSSVRTVELNEAQVVALSTLAGRYHELDPLDALAQNLELVTVGPPHALSPKIAATAALVKVLATEHPSVCVLTRHRRAVSLLRSMLRPLPLTLAEPADTPAPPASGGVVLARFEADLPDLTRFAAVVVLDYPFSSASLDRSVLPASATTGPVSVTVVHAIGSVDDRLAILSARRAEFAHLTHAASPPSAAEVAYLLAPRS